MPIEIAKVVVAGFEGYALLGAGFACLFLPRVIAHLDRRIEGSPKTLRLLLLPGVVALGRCSPGVG